MESHNSPKIKFLAIKEKDPKNILKNKLINIHSCDSKGQSALMITFNPNYMGYSFVMKAFYKVQNNVIVR